MRFFLVFALAVPMVAQRGAPQTVEEGIPVRDPLVIAKCSGCHTKDDQGNLSRISWERTTPEGWEEAIKRMVRLNGLNITPPEARTIVESLSASHGLAPEEAKPVMYVAEQRILDETLPDDNVRQACASCHAMGRPRSWRRSKEEWNLLAATHSAMFSVADHGSFYRNFPPLDPTVPAPPGQDRRQPLDVALDYLAKEYPLHTAEWSAWQARMRAPKLSGRWMISGSQAGRGKVIGEMQIEPGSSENEFTTSIKLTYLKDGSTVTRTGRSVVYTGYSWRGRSQSRSAPVDASPSTAGGVPAELREVMWIAPDQNTMEGRWFWGAYQEFGYDLKLQRVSDGPVVVGTDKAMLKSGSTAQRVRIFGDNLAKAAVSDIDFGSGVTVKRIVDATAQQVTVEVDIDAKAITGKRDVSVRRAVAAGAIAIYDKIDYIKVTPETSLARLGGAGHPKGFQQFEAIAYNRGPDGKPNTVDDVELGPVDAKWSVEEFYAVYGDDDKDFVGSLSLSGFFTPAQEGPNPKRKFGRNNYGDVWVVATYQDEGKSLTARSYLVVAIPLYVRWDQPEVGN
jgi:quinohemoprotein amine dehydrogenase